MVTRTAGPADTSNGTAVPAFQRMLESIPFLILVGLVMPTVVYTAWSITEIVRLPSFGEAGQHGPGIAGHGATAGTTTAGQSATTATDVVQSAGAVGPVQGTEVAPGAVRVGMRNLAFAQRDIEIESGTTVTWVNEDPFPHAVAHGTPDLALAEKAFYSGDFDSGWSYSYTFTEPGVYEIYCSTPGHFAAGMTMTVTVRGQ